MRIEGVNGDISALQRSECIDQVGRLIAMDCAGWNAGVTHLTERECPAAAHEHDQLPSRRPAGERRRDGGKGFDIAGSDSWIAYRWEPAYVQLWHVGVDRSHQQRSIRREILRTTAEREGDRC